MNLLENPYVSVVIPMYNLENYIADTLQSILNNDYKSYEIICVDDGSTDKTAENCRRFIRENPKIKLIQTENHGVSHARNTGLESSSGKYVVFMDGDDLLQTNALKIIEQNTESDCDILIFGADGIGEKPGYYDEFMSETNPKYGEYTYSPHVLFEQNGVLPYVWNKAYSRQFLLDNELRFDIGLRLGEDQVFLLSTFPKASKIRFIEDKLYIYRFQRPESATSTLSEDLEVRCSYHLGGLEIISAIWKSNGYYIGAERLFCRWCANFAVHNVLMVKSRAECVKLSKRLREIISRNDIPYKHANLKSFLKYEIISHSFLLRLFFVYRIFRWHI